jgi:hypothetical protein
MVAGSKVLTKVTYFVQLEEMPTNQMYPVAWAAVPTET